MGYKERIEEMRVGYKLLFDRLGNRPSSDLAEGVDKKKLEEAYNKIVNEYVWVLKKRTSL